MDSSTLYGFGIFGIIALALSILAIIVTLSIVYKTSLLHMITSAIIFVERSILALFNNNSPINSDVCSLVPGTLESVNRVPSLYLAHIAFFYGFLLMNAAVVYAMPEDTGLPTTYYDNRRNRALMTILILSLLYIGIMVFRYTSSSCDSLLGIIFTTSIFTALGIGWYKFAEVCGAQTADILGIAPSIVPVSAAPIVCASTPSPPPPPPPSS